MRRVSPIQELWRWGCVVGFPSGASGKRTRLPVQETKRHGFSPWVGKIPWRRVQQPTPVFLPGESHGQRSLMGYSPWGHKESDTAEATQHTHTECVVKTSNQEVQKSGLGSSLCPFFSFQENCLRHTESQVSHLTSQGGEQLYIN